MQDSNDSLIFVVEDNRVYNKLIVSYLKTNKFNNVMPFYSGEDTINNLYRNPDIIIQDFLLDGMNGIDVLKKAKEQNPNIEFIFLSGQTDIKVVLNALHQGAYDYIIKDAHAKENALIKIDQIARYSKIRKEKELYRKSIIIMVTALILSWALVFWYYRFHK